MGTGIRLFVASVLGGTIFSGVAAAQIVLSGSEYSQHFNSLASGLPPGWSVWQDATATSLGTPAVFETNVTSWADSSPEFRNCASVTNNSGLLLTNAAAVTQHSFTNRVLAVRQGGSFGDPGAAFVCQIADTLGFSNLRFHMDTLMLDAEGRETVWTVDYGLGDAPTNFTSLGTFTNTGPIGSITGPTYFLGADAEDQPERLTIRVATLAASTGGGSRDTFGLDNFRLAFDGGSGAEDALQAEHVGNSLILTWDDPSFGLQSAATAAGTFTNVTGASSPYTTSMNSERAYFRLAK
jgi:hypothetical protein